MALDIQNTLEEKAFNSRTGGQFLQNSQQFNELEYNEDPLSDLRMFDKVALAEAGTGINFGEEKFEKLEDKEPFETTADTTFPGGKRSKAEIMADINRREKQLTNYSKVAAANTEAIWQSRINPNLVYTDIAIDRKKSNIDRYLGYGRETFNRIGFSPFEDNEEVYNKNTTILDDMSRMSGQAWTLYTTGFMSNYRSIGNFFTGKSRELFDADEELAAAYEKANAIGYSTRGGALAFTNNLALQFSYTLGIIHNIAAEELALWGSAVLGSAVTGGASLGVAAEAQVGLGARALYRLRQAVSTVGAFNRVTSTGSMLKGGYDMFKAFRHVDDARQLWSGLRAGASAFGKGALRFVNPFENVTTLYGVERATAAYRNLSNFSKVQRSFGAFYRDFRAMGFAYSESDLEGGMVYNKRVEENVETFIKKNGRQPTDLEWKEIYLNAEAASKMTAMLNLPTIFFSNKVTFDGLMNFRGVKAITNAADDFLNPRNARGILWNLGSRKFFDAGTGVISGFKSTIKAFVKPKIYAGLALKYASANFVEGAQELTQELISGSVNNYYRKVYENPLNGNTDLIKSSIYASLGEDVFSAKGFETFLMGFLMGGMGAVTGAGVKTTLTGLPKAYTRIFKGKEEYIKQWVEPKKQARARSIDIMNNMISNDIANMFDNRKEFVVDQREASENMAQALINDDNYTYHNSKDHLTATNILFTLNNGTFDLFNSALNDLSKLTDKELAEAIGMEESNAGKAREKLQEYQTRANQIKEKWEYANENFQNPFNPTAYKKSGNKELYIREFIAKKAFDDAKKAFIFSQYGMERAVERMVSLFEDFNSFAPTSKMSATDLTILQTSEGIKKEIKVLKDEIEALDLSNDPKAKSLSKIKKQKLDNLTQYLEALSEYELNKVDDILDNNGRYSTSENAESIEKLYAAYGKYIATIAQMNEGSITEDFKILTSFRKLLDYYNLDADSKKYNRIVNGLLDPSNFLRYAERLQSNLLELYDNREDVLGQAIDNHFKAAEFNALIDAISKLGVIINPEEVEEFFRNGTIPKTYFDILKETVITEADPRYNAVKSMVELFSESLINDRKAKEAVTPEEEKAPEEEQEEKEFEGKTEIEAIDEEIKKLNDELANIADEADPKVDEIVSKIENLEKRREELYIESKTKKTEEEETPLVSDYGIIAAEYLFTGGPGTMMSTDYFIQALSGAFISAGPLIEKIRQKYISKIGNLGNLKEVIGTENYNNMIAEIRDAINKTYNNNAEIQNIFDVILNNATGFVKSEGDKISQRLEQLDEQLSAQKQASTTPVSDQAKKTIVDEIKEEIGSLKGEQLNIQTEGTRKIINAYRKLFGYPPYTGSMDSGLIEALKEASSYYASEVLSKMNRLELAAGYVIKLAEEFYEVDKKLGITEEEEVKPAEVFVDEQPSVINPQTFEGTLQPTDAEFINDYNAINLEIKNVISNPDVTPAAITEVFSKLFKHLNKLEKEQRDIFIKKHTAQRADLLSTIAKNKLAENTTEAKNVITKLFGSKKGFGNIVADIFNYINSTLGTTKKEEAIVHFENEYVKAVDAVIEKLKKNQSIVKRLGTALERLLKDKESFKKSVKQNIETLSKKADELIEKKKGISLTVDSPTGFTNPVHRSIISTDDVNKVSEGQKAAINIFIRTGILTQQEVDEFNAQTRHQASDIINDAVGRVYTWNINSTVGLFFEKGNAKELKEILAKYANNIGADKSLLDEALALIDIGIDKLTQKGPDGKSLFTRESFVEELGKIFITPIPSTKDVLTEEQRKVLNDFNFSIYGLMKETETLSTIELLDSIKEDVLSGRKPLEMEVMFPNDLFSKLKNYFKPELKKGKDNFEKTLDSFKEDFFNELVDLEPSSDLAKVIEAIERLNKKYIDQSNKNLGDAKSLLRAFVSHGIELQAMYSTGEETGVNKLSESEMDAILDKEEKDGLTDEQITQISEYAKGKKLDEYKKKLNAATGYVVKPLEYQPSLLEIEVSPTVTYLYSGLREKMPEDLRTTEDLRKKLDPNNTGKVSTKEALQMIIDSDFATDAEKELAAQLLPTIFEGSTIGLNDKLKAPGEFDPETGAIELNLNFVGYKENQPSAPIETVILHEILHQKIEPAIFDDNSEFAKGIRSVFTAVKKQEGASTFYAFQPKLSEDEQIREFVIEALTNPSFQYLLAKTPFANTKRSTWVKFTQLITDLLSKLGINISSSALSEVIALTSDLITPVTIQEEITSSTEEFMNQIKNAETLEELENILEDIKSKRSEISEGLFNSLKSHISGKIKTLKSRETSQKIKAFKQIKYNGKTYYYGIANNVLSVFRKTRDGYIAVKKENLLGPIILDLIDRSGDKEALNLFTKDLISDILSLTGDPRDAGSYASGLMPDEGSYIDTVHERAAEADVSLKFKSLNDLIEFESFIWKKIRVKNKFTFKKIKIGPNEKDLLEKKYGKTAVNDYYELVYRYGKEGFDLLIRKKAIGIGRRGMSLEDFVDVDPYQGYPTIDQLYSYYDDIVEGKDLTSNEYQDIKKYIKRRLNAYLGFKVPDSLQRRIEDLFYTSLMPIEDEYTDYDYIDTIDQDTLNEVGVVLSSNLAEKDYVENLDDVDFRTVDREASNAAMQPYGLRSYMWDFSIKNGEIIEHDNFKNYYYKVRSIINRLSAQDPEKLKGVHVTLDKDNANLRWDGSAQNEGWAKAEKGIIGYVSDANGNPIVFDKEGNQVGVLDRNNLSDKKGLDVNENQIIYFSTITETSKADILKQMDQTSLNQMFEARKKVTEGKPQIARLTRITPGQLSFKALVKVRPNNQKNTKRNTDIQEALLTQDNVTFDVSGPNLSAVITNNEGVSNKLTLFPPNSRYVSVELYTGEKFSLSDYIVQLYKVYNQMEVDGDPNAETVKNTLVDTIRNLWYTGPQQGLSIPNSMKNIVIGSRNSDGIMVNTTHNLIKIEDGKVVVNQENVDLIKKAIDQKRINVTLKWLNGTKEFNFPVIVAKDGKKTITFVQKSYKDFLIKEVGMVTYGTNIPLGDDLKAYHSQVHFENPSDLIKEEVKPPKTQQDDLVDNPNSIKNEVKKDVNDTQPSETAPKKLRKKLNAPFYNPIHQKICK